MISESQVRFIDAEIRKSPISIKELHDDLLDHLCCLVEEFMQKGLDFEAAYQKAYNQLSPGGFDEIQSETIFLLSRQKILLLQKVIYLSGYFFSFVVATGLLFKKMHWPWATMILICGIGGLLLVYLPVKLIGRYKLSISLLLSENAKNRLGIIAGVLVVLSGTMYGFDLQGASIVLMISFFVLSFGLMPYLFFKMYTSSIE